MDKRKIIAVAVIVAAAVVIAGVALYAKRTMAPSAPVSSGVSSSTSMAVAPHPTSSVSGGSYANGSFSFDYPAGWSVAQYAPFSLDTFKGAYEADGTIPSGGAELDVVTTTAYNGDGAIAASELMRAQNLATSTMAVDGVSCLKASYGAAYAPGKMLEDTALYCLRGTELWKVYFSYNVGDPAAAAHIADFAKMIGSMKFL